MEEELETGVIKKFLYVNRRAPHGTVYAHEALEVVLIGAAFDQDVSLAFIDDGVYLGTNVTILENVRICNHSIIGAFSLVNKSIPENITAFGVPCQVREDNK